MGQINFARVDARLIHGQVATAWSNSVGINAIYIVDNETANDDFMKMIYLNLQNNYSFSIKVLTLDEAAKLWAENQFDDDKVMLLFKDVKHAYELRKLGVPFEVLNVGGSPKNNENKFVADSVALTRDEYDMLVELSNKEGIDVYFQTMPSATKKGIKSVTY